jgi:hypothetical protein
MNFACFLCMLVTLCCSSNAIAQSANSSTVPSTREAKIAAMRAGPWGALSLLPGTLWYCIGYEPEQWMMRRRVYQGEVGYLDESIPVMRFTVATWKVPDRTMEVITKLGDGRGWTDVITRQPDGTFKMETTGVPRHASLTGRKDEYGDVIFSVATYSYSGGSLNNTIQFYHGRYDALTPRMILAPRQALQNETSCDMRPFDKAQLPEWTAELAKEQQVVGEMIRGHLAARGEFAADRVAGQQMVAGMQADLIGAALGGGGNGLVANSFQSNRAVDGAPASPFLQDLRNMADIAQRDAERSRQGLEAAITQASEVRSASPLPSADASISPPAGPSGVAATGALPTMQSAQAYLWVGMTPTPTNTRNPSCYSTPFTIRFEHAANGLGDNARAQAAVQKYEESFIAKCSRHGRVNGLVNGNVEGLTSGFPIPAAHAEDFVVQIP